MAARAVEGYLSSATISDAMECAGEFNITVWGTFDATLQVVRRFEGSDDWHPVTDLGDPVTFTAPFSETLDEPESDVEYAVEVTAFTSGVINYRISRA